MDSIQHRRRVGGVLKRDKIIEWGMLNDIRQYVEADRLRLTERDGP